MKIDDTKCWQECERTLELIHTTRENVKWHRCPFLRKINIQLPYNPALTLGCFLKRKESMCPYKELSTDVQNNLFVIAQNLNQLMSLQKQVDRSRTVVHTHSGIVFQGQK